MTSNSNVIKLGEYSFTTKKTSFLDKERCEHLNTTLYDDGQFVRCDDCGAHLSPYWVLGNILEQIRIARGSINESRAELELQRRESLHLMAAKVVEKAWRSKTMVPSCPHCRRGILPTDGFGRSAVNKEIEIRRRSVEEQRKKESDL